jgi:hypothetical protein
MRLGGRVLQRSAGTTGRRRAKEPVAVYEWVQEQGDFVMTKATINPGVELAEARKTMQDPEYAYVRIEGPGGVQADPSEPRPGWQLGQAVVRVADLRVTSWGPPYDAAVDYLDPHRLLAVTGGGEHRESTYGAPFEQWYLDQAVLMDAVRALDARAKRLKARNEDTSQIEDTKRRLQLAMTQAFSKSAEYHTSAGVHHVTLGAQTSPLLQGGRYHRSDARGSGFTIELRRAVARALGIDEAQIETVGDLRFREVLRREMPVYSARESYPQGLQDVRTTVSRARDFTQIVQALLANLDLGAAPSQTFVIDATRFYERSGATPADLQTKVAEPLEQILLSEATAHLQRIKSSAKRSSTRAEVVKTILNRLQVVVHAKHDGIGVVLMPKLLESVSAGQQKTLKTKDLLKHVDLAERGHFRERKTHEHGTVTTAIVESGARVDPIAAKEALLKLRTPKEILESGRIVQVELATGKQPGKVAEASEGPKPRAKTKEEKLVAKHPAGMNVDAFLKTNAFKSFRALSKVTTMAGGAPAPPYLRFYPEATCALLDGLATVKGPLGTVDETFAARGITTVLQSAYIRALGAMARAPVIAGDMVAFMDAVETIHDQLQLILGIVEPHAQQTAFAEGIVRALREPIEDPSAKKRKARPTLPSDLDAQVQHKASAMHSLASIVAGVEAQAAGRKAPVNTLVLKDNYYESAGAVEHSHANLISILDGYKLGNDPLQAEHFKGGAKPPAPFDIFICDFHHNISVERNEYHLEKVVHQVDELFRLGLVAERFTVAIDCTVDFLRSLDVRAFLEHFKDRIDRGELNVVLYRSAQKFDMLGMDNYYGGYTITINDGRSYALFDKRMNAADDQVTGLAHQGVAHLGQFGTQAGDDYRRALIKNTKLLYDKLVAKGLDERDAPIRIGTSTDPNNVFLDIQFPDTEALEKHERNPGDTFSTQFTPWAQDVGRTALTQRPSFGFATTNLTTIGGSKTRLNPGLEDEAVLDRYADFFAWFKERLTEPRKLAKAEIAALKATNAQWPHTDDTSEAMALARALGQGYAGAFRGAKHGAPAERSTGSLDLPGPAMIESPQEGGARPSRRRKTPKASGGPAAVQAPADTRPPPANLAIDDALRPNPYLWCCENSAGDYNYKVADHKPGRGWWYIEQFCGALAIHWLEQDQPPATLAFADLGTLEQRLATVAVKRWGGRGIDQQAKDARNALGGTFDSRGDAVDAVAKKQYARGTRMWFGNARHSEGALRTKGGRWRVYDPNTGLTTIMGATAFATHLESQSVFAVKTPAVTVATPPAGGDDSQTS